MFPFYFAPADELEQKIFRFCWNCLKQQDCCFFFFLKNNQLGQNMSKDFSAEIKKTGGKGRFQRKGNAEAKIGANEDSMLWRGGGGG